MNLRLTLSLALPLLAVASVAIPRPVDRPSSARTVALTFDDVPLGQGQPGTRCNGEKLLEVSRSITGALREFHAPVAAFITTGNICDQIRNPVLGEVIRTWQRSGAAIGNHGHRHLDPNTVPRPTYIADLALADSLIRDALGAAPRGSLRYFRHPFLHVGADSATARGIERWLDQHQYTVAPVTVDNNEWIYARAYTLALARRDSAMLVRLVPAYLEHIDQAFAFAESMSVRVVGEEIPQILLLHANELNRDHLREVLKVIEGRGYHFVSLAQALGHPAYRRPTQYLGPWGISWILRWSRDSMVWRMDLPKTPEWVEQ
ncbi:MAG: polysaccharide deacetylase family protein [Gemmatimonadota bacterium]